MENWETCVFFCFSYSPCCYQASGRGRVYGSTSATKKSILLPKNSHSHSYSVSHVRGSITRHISIQQFSEKNRKYQTNFLCGRFHQSSTQAQGGDIMISFFIFHFPIFVFHFLIFTSPFWKNGNVKNKNEITMWPPWASVVYITYLKIFFIACYFVQRYC